MLITVDKVYKSKIEDMVKILLRDYLNEFFR